VMPPKTYLDSPPFGDFRAMPARGDGLAMLKWISSFPQNPARGLPTVIGRLFNTVGPRQTGRYGMVLPNFVRQGLAGQPITVYGDGSQRRCFCHVRDVVRALADLMATDAAYGEVFNIGATEETTIMGLAERVRDMVGSSSEIVTVPYDEAYEQGFEDMRRRIPDTGKISQLLGWSPTSDLDAILQDVVESQRSEEAVETSSGHGG